jgi:hypothetical protein
MNTQNGRYGASHIRRLNSAELEELDSVLIRSARVEQPISVRGLFYRATSHAPHLIDKSESGYNKIQRRVLLLRRAGRIPYAWIPDGTRYRLQPTTWDSVEQAIDATAASYRRNMWIDSPDLVEIWAEKDAIRGVLQPVTHKWDVPLLVARGYTSESFIHATAQEINASGKERAFIYQMGDHDPSGVGAWDDIQNKLRAFVDDDIEMVFERLSVTPEQIEELGLPTRPTKKSDTRAKKFAGESVEVDAVETPVLRGLLEDAISRHVDPTTTHLHKVCEDNERAFLTQMAGSIPSAFNNE